MKAGQAKASCGHVHAAKTEGVHCQNCRNPPRRSVRRPCNRWRFGLPIFPPLTVLAVGGTLLEGEGATLGKAGPTRSGLASARRAADLHLLQKRRGCTVKTAETHPTAAAEQRWAV